MYTLRRNGKDSKVKTLHLNIRSITLVSSILVYPTIGLLDRALSDPFSWKSMRRNLHAWYEASNWIDKAARSWSLLFSSLSQTFFARKLNTAARLLMRSFGFHKTRRRVWRKQLASLLKKQQWFDLLPLIMISLHCSWLMTSKGLVFLSIAFQGKARKF